MFKQAIAVATVIALAICSAPCCQAGPRTVDGKKKPGLPKLEKKLADGGKNSKTVLPDINERLQTILPSLEAKNASLESVMSQIGKKAGVPIVVSAGIPKDVTVTMSFSNIPAGEAIRYTCAGAGVSYRITPMRVIIESAKAGQKK